MATVTLKQHQKRQFGGTPYGNLTAYVYELDTGTTGAALDSDSSVALAIGDVVDLGPLPEGMRLDGASIFVTVGMSASVTGSLGFKYEDGVDSADVPQDAVYFATGVDLATTGRKTATGKSLATLPKAARLILTTAGAANAKASELKVLVSGELTGPR